MSESEQPARAYSAEELNAACDRVFLQVFGTTTPGKGAPILKFDPSRNGNGKEQADPVQLIKKLVQEG